MNRSANEIVNHQMAAIRSVNFQGILSDYAKNLVAITYLNGHAKTVGYDTLAGLAGNPMGLAAKWGMQIGKPSGKPRLITRQGVGNYAVIAGDLKPMSSFATFTVIARNNQAAYVTGVARTLKLPSLGIKPHPFPPGPETMKVVDRHLLNLQNRNATALAEDYAPDVVILTNLSPKPFVGAAEAGVYSKGLIRGGESLLAAATPPAANYFLKQAAEDLCCVAFQDRAGQKFGVFTFLVQGGKIQFESAMFQNEAMIF